MTKEQQVKEMVSVLKDYTAKNHIMASVVILEDYAEQIYNADFRKQSEWISVDERLPDAIDSYIVVVKQKYEWEAEWEYDTDVASFVFCDGYIDGVWNTYNDWKEGQECHITHWMPLPEPPKMKGGAEEW